MTSAQFTEVMQALAPHLVAVAVIAARLLPIAFLCPLFGGSTAPTTVKLGVALSFALCLHLGGGVGHALSVVTVLDFVALSLKELVLGVALGLLASLPFDAARMGGRFIDLFRGSSAEAALPQAGTKEAASADGLYQLTVAGASVGAGLPLVLAAIFKSYGALPIDAFVATEATAMHLVAMTGAAFTTGLAIGAPVAGIALAIDALLGLVARAVPQLNLQDTGAPLKILGGAAVLWLGIGALSTRLLDEVGQVEGAMAALWSVGQ